MLFLMLFPSDFFFSPSEKGGKKLLSLWELSSRVIT